MKPIELNFDGAQWVVVRLQNVELNLQRILSTNGHFLCTTIGTFNCETRCWIAGDRRIVFAGFKKEADEFIDSYRE